MQKNITLSADAALIERSRMRAMRRHTTLNVEFRKWLERYVAEDVDMVAFDKLKSELSYCLVGKKFDRDAANER